MFYLVSTIDDKIVQIVDNSSEIFEVHNDLIWVEGEPAPYGFKTVCRNREIAWEQLAESTKSFPMMHSVSGRDLVFCFGSCAPNTEFNNPNNSTGSYNQCVFLLEGSASASNSDNTQQLAVDNIGCLHDVSSFKGSSINYNIHNSGAKWVAVNPLNNIDVNVTVINGPTNQIITDNTNGITVFNAKGTVIVNGGYPTLNDPVFYHAETDLDIQLSEDSYLIVVKY